MADDDEQTGVRITNAAIYKQQLATDKKVEEIAAVLPIHIADTKAQLSDHEGRLRILEASRWKTIGMSGLAAAVIAAVPAIYYLSHLH